jgi:hypothetical protein
MQKSFFSFLSFHFFHFFLSFFLFKHYSILVLLLFDFKCLKRAFQWPFMF